MILENLVHHLNATLKASPFHRPIKVFLQKTAIYAITASIAIGASTATLPNNAYAKGPSPLSIETATPRGVDPRILDKRTGQIKEGAVLFTYKNKTYVAGKNYQLPDDDILKHWMSQPVETTLGDIPYTPVNDNNYQTEVLGADRPTMVLFYNKSDLPLNTGLATLVKNLSLKFPQIKLCTYKVTDVAIVSKERGKEVYSKYPIEETPSIAFYDNKTGTIKYLAKLGGGIKSISNLKKQYDKYEHAIPKFMLN